MSVDRHTLQTRWPNVYAISDVVSIPLALGKPLPKAGVFAHKQAHVVATNIADDIAGRGQAARFDGHGECFIEVGGHVASARLAVARRKGVGRKIVAGLVDGDVVGGGHRGTRAARAPGDGSGRWRLAQER